MARGIGVPATVFARPAAAPAGGSALLLPDGPDASSAFAVSVFLEATAGAAAESRFGDAVVANAVADVGRGGKECWRFCCDDDDDGRSGAVAAITTAAAVPLALLLVLTLLAFVGDGLLLND